MGKMISEKKKQEMKENLFIQWLKVSGEEELPVELDNQICDYAMDEDWENLCFTMLVNSRWAEAFCGDGLMELPDEYIYQIVIGLYTKLEGIGPGLAYRLITARAYGSPEFLAEYDGKDFITVYRGSHEAFDEAPVHFSWTTDKEKAIYFMLRPGLNGDGSVHLYQGKIKKDDVIAYTDSRNEKEIIQFCDIQDMKELITLTREQVSEINQMDTMEEQIEKAKEYENR